MLKVTCDVLKVTCDVRSHFEKVECSCGAGRGGAGLVCIHENDEEVMYFMF